MTGLATLLAGTSTIVTSELVPPRGADAEGVRRQVDDLSWADALNVTDLPQARVRMSALAGCALAIAAGTRPILQMTCRDRNRLALAADAIGAAAMGVEAVLPLFGDPVPADSPAAENRDIDSAGLVALLRELGGRPHARRAGARPAGPPADRRRGLARPHDGRAAGRQGRRRRDVRADADRARRRRLRGLAGDRARRGADGARGDPRRHRHPAQRGVRRARGRASAPWWRPDVARARRGAARASPWRARSSSACCRCRASAALHLMPLGAAAGASWRSLATHARSVVAA